MAPKSTREWSRSADRGREDATTDVTIGDLCRAIEERRIRVTRYDDEYRVSVRDLRRWLDGGEPSAGPRRRQRPAS